MQNRKPHLARAAAVLLAFLFFTPATRAANPAAALPKAVESPAAPASQVQTPGQAVISPALASAFPAANGYVTVEAPSSLPPTTVSKGKDGFTTWSVDWGGQAWCVPVSTLRYPFDLKGQDPTELANATLNLSFSESPMYYLLDETNEPYPYWEDPSWGVGLNGQPPSDWQQVGNIETEPAETSDLTVSDPLPLDTDDLIDGENNVWLQQHDHCPQEPGCTTCACTCVTLEKVELRATVDLEIASVTPEDKTRNVWFDQRSNSEIRVKFTTVVSTTSVNLDTFQVYYLDANQDKVYADGKITPISNTEYAFTPKDKLLDGVLYTAQVWGQDDAEADNRDKWIQDVSGGPLVDGDSWSFWTIPQLQVTLVPVQVLENQSLVKDKPTELRTFVRWDLKPGVYPNSQAPNVEVDDVTLTWVSLDGNDTGLSNWRDVNQWQPVRDPKTALRKREYKEYTNYTESYANREKWYSLDSVNYSGFTPRTTGNYLLSTRVLVNDSRGTAHPFRAQVNLSSYSAPQFGIYMKAVAVGGDYGKTGTVDLSAPIHASLDTFQSLYPLSSLTRPPAPSATAYYTPTTNLWINNWATEPASGYPKQYLLEELSNLCRLTTGCRVMVGFARPGWLVDQGVTLPEAAPFGALVKNDVIGGNTFVMAHEIGHLAHFEHIEEPSGEGFRVSTGADKRYSVDKDVFDFMTIDPIESSATQLWISNWHYISLAMWTGAAPYAAENSPAIAYPALVESGDPMLLAAGTISETTGAVNLLPWYQMDPGQYLAPEAGPYSLVFLNGANQEIVGYTRAFTTSARLLPAGGEPTTSSGPAFFSFVTPYPASVAKIQIRRLADNALLKEISAGGAAPGLSINSPGSSPWQGPQTITWQSDAGTRYNSVQVSTDNGVTWEALAINLTGKSFTLQTMALPNTSQARLRISVSDGLRTTSQTAGPFTIHNPPQVGYVTPSDGASQVSIRTSIEAGFRDAMDPATFDESTFTVTGGPNGAVSGVISYTAGTKSVTFNPKAPLACATTYTARLTTGVKDAAGQALPAAKTWTFTTAADWMPPQPLGFMPQDGAVDVVINASLVVAWDKPLNAGTLTPATFTLAAADGSPVSGAVSYDAAARTATFTPSGSLAADTIYIATLKGGLQDTLGNATPGDYTWSFTTGKLADSGFGFTHAYLDYGIDSNGDGLYDQLAIMVGVQVTTTGVYSLSGSLADSSGAKITLAEAGATLQPGSHFLSLFFDGSRIGGHGIDGPYTLANLTFFRTDGAPSAHLLGSVTTQDTYRTFDYSRAKFPAPLLFTGLPDVSLPLGAALNPAFNVRSFAHHGVASSDQLSYTLVANTDPRAGVTLGSEGSILINPHLNWRGVTQVTIQARYGDDLAQDSFQVRVGWKVRVNLPIVLDRTTGSPATPARSNWHVAFTDSFESSFTWRTWSSISVPPGGWYYWGLTQCASNTGAWSASPFKGGDDGSLTTCNAPYPNTLVTTMRYGPAVNLKYTSQAEFSAKIWTDLAPGDQICAMVTVDDLPDPDIWQAMYYGVCRSGTTNGWEDIKLDLSQVPILGNVLGREKVFVALKFIADDTGNRPVGVYVDDAMLRLCPQGLTCQP